MSILSEFGFAYGRPNAHAKVKFSPQDFKVSEDLGFEFTHQGEHLMVRISKTGDNTRYVANELAKACNVPSKNVSWAGLKDRHAVTEQWLSIQAPKQELNIQDFEASHPSVKILEMDKHSHKLKPGDLKGNAFEIRLVEVSDMEDVLARLEQIKIHGVPNYFGEQRFGHQGNNVSEARRWGRDNVRTRDQAKRSMYLSAARSWLFNHIVSKRIQEGMFNQVMLGDMVIEHDKFQLVEDVAQYDRSSNNITAALAGDNALPTTLQAQIFEQAILDTEPDLMALIRGNRMRHDRRAINITPTDLQWKVDDQDLVLMFSLPSGSFATAILRELVNEVAFERQYE